MAEPRVHFDVGRSFFGHGACGNYLVAGSVLDDDPKLTTCANCQRSKKWRKAAGLPESQPSRGRLHMNTSDGSWLRASSTDPEWLAGLRRLAEQAGMTVVSGPGRSDD